MLKAEMAELLADHKMPQSFSVNRAYHVRYYMKHTKAELGMLLDAATNPDAHAAMLTRIEVQKSESRRQFRSERTARLFRPGYRRGQA